MLLMPKSA